MPQKKKIHRTLKPAEDSTHRVRIISIIWWQKAWPLRKKKENEKNYTLMAALGQEGSFLSPLWLFLWVVCALMMSFTLSHCSHHTALWHQRKSILDAYGLVSGLGIELTRSPVTETSQM